MAASLLYTVVSDLCLGKPPLRSLSVHSTVADALAALKNSGESAFLSVWRCNQGRGHDEDDDGIHKHDDGCECVGKVCMVDVICYLCKYQNFLLRPLEALKASVSVLLHKINCRVERVEPSCSLLEAIDLMIQGAQNLVVPIQPGVSTGNKARKQTLEFCWITREDVIRYMLGSICLFRSLPATSIADLGIISSIQSIPVVDFYSKASSAIPAILQALADETSVAVTTGGSEKPFLIGEISPDTLACCDETAAAALAFLTVGGLMGYLEGVVSSEELKALMEDKGLMDMIAGLESSEDECCPTRCGLRPGKRWETSICGPKSSLMAVMMQGIANRVNYVWVAEENGRLVGMVKLVDALKVLRDGLQSVEQEP